MRSLVACLLLVTLPGCSWGYARLTYEFKPLVGSNQILYEQGAEDLARLVAASLPASLSRVEAEQHAAFKDVASVKIYVFNDRKRYAAFSHASVLTRGSSTTDEVYLSAKLRERIDTLPGILTHELSHVHVRQYVGTFKYVTDVPSWFLEGMAVCVSSGAGAENVTADEARAALREGIQFKPDESSRLIGPKSAASYGLEAHMYYRQASLFVEYLVTQNPRGFESALADLRAGGTFRDVWKKHYGQSIPHLWRDFEKHIEA